MRTVNGAPRNADPVPVQTGLVAASPRAAWTAAGIVLVAAAVLRMAFALTTPAWQNADEYPHYWVAEQIAATGRLPLSEPVHPRYEAFQAPLHYLALAGVKALAWPDTRPPFTYDPSPLFPELAAYRLLSVALSSWMLLAAWRVLCAPLARLRLGQALAALAFLAFLPTYAGVSAGVNNDVSVILFSTLAVSAAAAGRGRLTGGWLALAVLSKVNAVFMAVPLLALEGIRWMDAAWKGAGFDLRALFGRLRPILLPLAGALIVLVARNLWLYGDLQGVNPGAPKEFRADPGVAAWALRNLFWSFWYAFGRIYEVQLPLAGYALLALAVAVVVGRGGWIRWRGWRSAAGTEGVRGAWVFWISWLARHPLQTLFVVGFPVFVLASLVYTLSYPFGTMTSWGKNLYPLLLPIAGTLAWVGAPDRTGVRLLAAGCAGLLGLCTAALS